MWIDITCKQFARKRLPSPRDLTEAEWVVLAPHFYASLRSRSCGSALRRGPLSQWMHTGLTRKDNSLDKPTSTGGDMPG
jgi:hypothetical protein